MEEIKDILNSLELIPAVKQSKKLAQRLSSINEKLEEQTFQLVVLGQFKRGKTSLINALVGKDLLPVAIVPLTSIITILKYGKKEKIATQFLDGRKKEIQPSELPEYVTEIKNPKNEKGVEQVTIEYPLEFLKSGVQIIDTPGVGSVYKHNTDVSYEFVPKADAGIFVVTADPPISDSELQFLKSIKDYLAKTIFVQNKIDQVEEKDRLESLEFSKKVIEEAVGKHDPQFYQVSAKSGSGIVQLKDSLKQLFKSKKEQLLLLSVAYKLLPIVGEIELALGVEKQALQMSLDELKKSADIFKAESEKIRQEKEDDSFILQGQAERLTKQVLIDDIEALKEQKQPELLVAYEKFFAENKHLNGKELDKKFDKFLAKLIKDVFNRWRKEEEQKLSESLKTIITRFSDQTNQYIGKIIDLSSDLFNLKLKKFQADSSLASEVEFRFAFDEYEVNLDLYTPVVTKLPKFISNKILYSKMKNDVLDQFDRHCGRARFDFHQRIIKSIYDYENKLDEIMESTITGIEKALSKALSEKEAKEESQDKEKSNIEKQLQNLSEIRVRLEKLTKNINV